MTEAEELAGSLLSHFASDRIGPHLPFVLATERLSAQQAAGLPAAGFNSIWAITNHIRFWQEAMLRLLQGHGADWRMLGALDPSGWPPAGDPADDDAWLADRARALDINAQLAACLRPLDAEALAAPLPSWGLSIRQAGYSLIAHNGYHTAEIITVRHMQGWWLDQT
jgi:hypothetical protein